MASDLSAAARCWATPAVARAPITQAMATVDAVFRRCDIDRALNLLKETGAFVLLFNPRLLPDARRHRPHGHARCLDGVLSSPGDRLRRHPDDGAQAGAVLVVRDPRHDRL